MSALDEPGFGPERRILMASLGLISTLLLGAVGYELTEPQFNFFDSLWLALITSTTVGYGDLHPETAGGRLVTVGILGSGFLFVSLATASFVELLVEGRIAKILGRRSLNQSIQNLKDHYIVCGYGRMGRLICREICAKVPTIVIEHERDNERRLVDEGITYIIGDATEEEVLEQAGIERAKGLISVVASDAENVFIALTAREMNRDLTIIARAIDERSERKLRRAGANKVISPYLIGGLRMAQAVLKPAVVDFLEFILHNNSLDVQAEEIRVGSSSELVAQPLKSSGISRFNVIVLAIKRGSGRMEFNPSGETVIQAGDTLIVVGPNPGLKKLEDLACFDSERA